MSTRITYSSWDRIEPPKVEAIGQPDPMIAAVKEFCRQYAQALEALARDDEEVQ